ncbi:MAG: 4Fe-4S dicluster domain-containing protein [Pseudomonadota bacterium]
MDSIRSRIEAAGVVDSRGRALCVDDSKPTVVIGKVADCEPLFGTDRALAERSPQALVQGLSAVSVLVGARRALLAVRQDWGDLSRKFRNKVRETDIEIEHVDPVYPMDDASLVCDLAQAKGLTVEQAGFEIPVVLDAAALCDVATVLSGKACDMRTVSVCGAVRKPQVIRVPLGTAIQDLVKICGGSPDFGWIAYHNGVLGGRFVGQDGLIELHTRGVTVLPHDHPLMILQTVPLEDEKQRNTSACVNCRICTDICPVWLNGGQIQPHQIMQDLATSWSLDNTPDAMANAIQCVECKLCSVNCPSSLRPAELIVAIAVRLREQGRFAHQNYVFKPVQDRPGRRFSVERLEEMLGLRSFRG